MQPYFSHDIFTRENLKIKRLINKHKMLGYGVFWAVVEFLHNNDNKLSLDELSLVAFDIGVDEALVDSVIKDFKLFSIKKNIVSSKRVARNFKLQKEKSETARNAANFRWQRASKDADVLRTHSECNAIKEKKEIKENKKNKKKEEETTPENNNFYGSANNVYLTPQRYGSLAAQYGKSLADTIISELSYNIAAGKEQAFNAEFSDMHYLRLERYAKQKLQSASSDGKSLSDTKQAPPLQNAQDPKGEKQECEALRHIREVAEVEGVPPPKSFHETGKRLKMIVEQRAKLMASENMKTGSNDEIQ